MPENLERNPGRVAFEEAKGDPGCEESKSAKREAVFKAHNLVEVNVESLGLPIKPLFRAFEAFSAI